MIQVKSLYLEGLFDEQDWAQLIHLLQRIEERHPEHDYKAYVVEGTREKSVEEVIEFFKRSLPQRPGRQISIFKRNK